MVCTVGAARGLDGRGGAARAGVAYAVGSLLGGVLVFGGLGLLASRLHPGRFWLEAAVALAAVAAVSDLAGLRVRPQLPFQVPERWRQTLPLPLATLLYGLLIGTGLTTYVPAAAAWALLALTLALGKLAPALVIGVCLGAGRALPVVGLAPLRENAAARRAFDRTAQRRWPLRSVRALAALALAAGGAAALAGPGRADVVATGAEDPSVAGADLAWQAPGTGGFLLHAGGAAAQLPGSDPAIGGALIAWHVGAQVTVASRQTLAPVAQENVPGVQKLAVSDRWLAYRAGTATGGARIVVQQLTDLANARTVASVSWPAQLGRPALSGNRVVFHTATQTGSSIAVVDLSTGKRRLLRRSRSVQVLEPALLGSDLLYVRVARCSQQLRLGGLAGGRDRVLLTLPPLAGQDLGRERGHTDQGSRVPCPGRPRPTTTMLWTTALTTRFAYVTTLHRTAGGSGAPTLLRITR